MTFLRQAAALAIVMSTGVAIQVMAQPRISNGIITDEKGMSLYSWDNHPALCEGPCSLSWPPMLVETGTKAPNADFGTVKREDGKLQWTYKGRALYRWVNDKKPGDTDGDGFRKGLWHLAKP